MNISPKNLTTAPINWSLLPKNLQSEKGNLELYQEFYEEEPSIKENVDKLIEVIKKTHAANPSPVSKKAKGIKKLPAKTPAVKQPSKRKKVVSKSKALPKTNMARKPKPKRVESKALITLRKLSPELQIIKSFALMDSKSRKLASMRSFLKRAETAKKNSNVTAQKKLLTEIIQRVKQGLKGIPKDVETISVSVNADLLQKCKAAVKNAQPRLQVQYLSGLKGKK